MTDNTSSTPSASTAPDAVSSTMNPGPQPTYEGLTAMAEQLFNTGAVATQAQADALRATIDRLLAPGRGGTLDFSDPANSGLIPLL